MNVHEQNPPTDLTVFLNKSKFEEKKNNMFCQNLFMIQVMKNLLKEELLKLMK